VSRHPPPSYLLDQGDYLLQLICAGQDSPVSLLEVGMGGASLELVRQNR
jgi:hypothetical protein